jgi:hypothetical protein
MALKKSDKLIAIVGVLILIVAGIAIFFYSSPEEEVPKVIKEKTYTYTWVSHEENMTFTDRAVKRQEYLADIIIDLSEGKVLTSVNFWINWKDDYTRGLLIRKGEDKLTVKVSYAGEEYTHKSTKRADESFADFNINNIPQDEVYTTDDEDFDPIEYIKDMYYGENSATFNLSVKVVTGEKLLTLRPLKFLNFLRDRGNKFNLIVTYEYYDFDYEEQEDNMPSTGNQGGDGDTYSHLNFTGFK